MNTFFINVLCVPMCGKANNFYQLIFFEIGFKTFGTRGRNKDKLMKKLWCFLTLFYKIYILYPQNMECRQMEGLKSKSSNFIFLEGLSTTNT